MTEAAILRTNGIKSYRQIKPGRMLVIPMAGASRGMLAGKLLEDRRSRVQGRAIVATAVVLQAPPARAEGALYTVRAGDSLWTIAAKFATTVDKLKRLNGLNGRRARALQVGQTIAVRES